MVPDVMELHPALGYGSATDVDAFPKNTSCMYSALAICAAHVVSWPPGPGPRSEFLVRLAFDLAVVPLRKEVDQVEETTGDSSIGLPRGIQVASGGSTKSAA